VKPEVAELRQRLADAFPEAAEIAIDDDSAAHAGHAGAAGGAGHFKVRILSPRFAGMPTLARHRLVYDAVADWMPHRIHALSIDARPAPTDSSKG
jgi:BolA protein